MDDPNLKGVELSGSKKHTGLFIGLIAVAVAVLACVAFFLLYRI